MQRKISWLITLILVGLCFGRQYKKNSSIIINKNNFNEQELSIIIEIKGAVNFPGIYVVSSNDLLIDVINLAGGLSAMADVEKINLVSKVNNNEMIMIPYLQHSSSDTEELININQASKADLMKLSGIGDAKAMAIIEYRNVYGFFKSIEDLKQVSGISESLFEKIKTNITI